MTYQSIKRPNVVEVSQSARDAEGQLLICTGCGSSHDLEALRAARPGTLSCCPERKMMTVFDYGATAEQRGLARHEAERAALVAEVARLREALEWYADEVMVYSITQANEPRSVAHADKGKRARAALKARAKAGEGA